MWQFAEQFHCNSMKEKAQSIVKRQFTIVSRLDDFLFIPPQLLCEILGYDDLNLGVYYTASL